MAPPCYSSPAPLPLPNLAKSSSRLLPSLGTNRYLSSPRTRYTRHPPHTRTHTPRHNHTPRTASRDTIRRHHTPPHFATYTHSRIESLMHSQSDTRRYSGGASGRCWWCVMSLILWIARKHYGCRHLNDYVDDVFAAALATSLLLYPRYMVLMPRPQVQFLRCLDTLDVPHERPKQLSG